MTLIDGDKIITAQLYDDEHEEFINKKMSIIDYINTYTNEGVIIADDVLNKIKAEIEKIETYDGLYIDRAYVLQIIDKYRVESEEI